MSFCSVENCWNNALKKGWCGKHYQQFYRKTHDYRPNTGRRSHPFYALWFDRKSSNVLCDEWINDFDKFVYDISPKPEGNYLLVRITKESYGPNNFKWQEHLKRREGEPKKDWWARKWAARQAANPGMERERNLVRKYGITIKQYNEMLQSQNFVCAICEKEETSVCGISGTLKRLAVDHCHKTGKNRSLLCGRCNTTLGKVEEDLELIERIVSYIRKHNNGS